MTKNIIPIVCALFDKGAFDAFTAITISDVMRVEYVDMSYSTIYNVLNDLFHSGCVRLGYNEQRAHTSNKTGG